MVTVECLEPGAWRRARAIRLRALADAPDAFWTTLEGERRTPPREWRRRLAQPDAATFVAVADGVDVGLAVGAPHHDHAGDAGLYALWVAPEARGAGVGTALISAVIAWARNAGHGALRLDVGDTNLPAIRLYEAMGFAPSGETFRFPPPRDHIREHERVLRLR